MHRVIVTIDHNAVSDIHTTKERLRESGLKFEDDAEHTVFGITQIIATTDKDPSEFNFPGVTCDVEHWKSEQ